jgi:hypothetical protein
LVFLVVAAVAVFVIAATFVGSEAFRLGHETPAAIFDVDEAVDRVGDGLPPDVQARLTYDEVRQLILATLEHLRDKGLSARPGETLPLAADQEVVVDDDVALAAVLGAVEARGLDVTDDDAALVIDALLRHLDDIGALGPRA